MENWVTIYRTTLLIYMKYIVFVLLVFNLKSYSQKAISGNWEIKASNYSLHPFEKDTLTLTKPDTIKNEITNEISIITGKRDINLLSFSNSIDAEYIPNFHQSIDTGFVQGYFSGNYADTLVKQYNSLAVLQNEKEIEFIFYNNFNSLIAFPTSKKTLMECISKDKKHLRFYYKINYQSPEKILLIKNLP